MFRSKILPIIVIVFGGFLSAILVYATYLGVYLSIEALFYPDPTQTPTDTIRTATSIALCVIWVLLLRTKIPEMVKATLGVGPLTMLIVNIFYGLYLYPVWVYIAIGGLGVILVTLIALFKKPWFYYVALGIVYLVCLLYYLANP